MGRVRKRHLLSLIFQFFQWFRHMYWMRISATYRKKNIKESTVFSGKIHALKCMFLWVIIGQGGRYTIQPPKQSEAGVSGRWNIQNTLDCKQSICFGSRLRWVRLTHWGRDMMVHIFQTTSSNALLSWMNMLEFWIQFDWSLFIRVYLTIIHHWFR